MKDRRQEAVRTGLSRAGHVRDHVFIVDQGRYGAWTVGMLEIIVHVEGYTIYDVNNDEPPGFG